MIDASPRKLLLLSQNFYTVLGRVYKPLLDLFVMGIGIQVGFKKIISHF